MKLYKVLTFLVLFSLLVFIPSPGTADTAGRVMERSQSMRAPAAELEGWFIAPFPPGGFQYARHDSAFIPGLASETWANKVYFLGGRTSPPTESPNIWVFDPIELTYTDTGVDVIEDVSNYNANIIFDDGTGRGPAIYIVGGTNKDGGGTSIGLVQRFYPKTYEMEGLPVADNWNGTVGGARVAAMGTAVVEDQIYVFGGWETNAAPYFSTQTWVFDPKLPSGSRWTNLNLPLNVARSYVMSAVQGGKIYAIGGVGLYDGSELDPVDAFEVLDTTNLAAGWQTLDPMPFAGGEGRAFGFDADTLNIAAPWENRIYVVAANDWAAVSNSFIAYDVTAGEWMTETLPTLPTARADLAASYIPICTSDPNDGLPGLWTFGGRVNESCDPPLGPTEYYDLACDPGGCTPLTSVVIDGPTQVVAGEAGAFTADIDPPEATVPVTLSWDNATSGFETTYTWDTPGFYTLVITGTNCDGSAVVTDSFDVEVLEPCHPLTGVEITGPQSLLQGETGIYSVTLTPADATGPFEVVWDGGAIGMEASYSWTEGGMFTINVIASNCNGTSVVLDAFDVHVAFMLRLPLVMKP